MEHKHIIYMGGWMVDERMDEQVDGWTDECMDRQVDSWMDGQMDR